MFAPRARGRNSYNRDYQTELRIFIRFEVVDTLGSSQVLFWYQDFTSKSNGSQFTGIYAPCAREKSIEKYVAARQDIRLLWILDIMVIYAF